MKKSKIIIPALGMLLLSTAASVSGTVAWFTSMQTGQAQITSFAVAKTGGTLSVTQAAGVGTVLSGSAITLKTGIKLTHGSYDHTADSIWKPNDTLDVFTAQTRTSALTSEYLWTMDGTSSSAGTMYYAVSWQITLGYTFQGDTRNVYVYFDGIPSATSTDSSVSGSYFTHSNTVANDTATYEKYTYKGFRLSMISTAENGPKIIWAPGTNTGADEKFQHGATGSSFGYYSTDSTGSTTANTYYAAGSLLDSSFAANYRSGNLPSNPTQQPNYVGTFVSGSATSIVLNCVAWFEGNDSNVVDAAELDQVTATMKFYTRIAPAA